MVEIRSVPGADVPAVCRLHNRLTASDESRETVLEWHRAHPELFVGAYDGDRLVGYCLGVRRTETDVEVAGIGVEETHRRRGVGTELLDAFEDRAASSGFRRVSLGSAGGYVDEFYRRNGYAPESVLVRLDPEDAPAAPRATGYEITEERTEGDTRKLYVAADGFDPEFLADVRAAFGDPDAIYVVAKDLDCDRDPPE